MDARYWFLYWRHEHGRCSNHSSYPSLRPLSNKSVVRLLILYGGLALGEGVCGGTRHGIFIGLLHSKWPTTSIHLKKGVSIRSCCLVLTQPFSISSILRHKIYQHLHWGTVSILTVLITVPLKVSMKSNLTIAVFSNTNYTSEHIIIF